MEPMIKKLKVILYPDENQRILLEKHFGSCRFVWNHFLDVRDKCYAEHETTGRKVSQHSIPRNIHMLTGMERCNGHRTAWCLSTVQDVFVRKHKTWHETLCPWSHSL